MKFLKSIDLKLDYLPYYFAFYSFFGWLMETVYLSIRTGSFVKRGFLIGPFCPIYGFGAIILIFLLTRLKKNVIVLFTSALILTSTLEYLSGVLLKLIFNRMWWSYYNEAFNLDGVICLKVSIIWGVFSIFLVKFIHPFVERVFDFIPRNTMILASQVIILYFAVDLAITINSLVFSNYEHKFLIYISYSYENKISHAQQITIDTVKSFIK